MSAAGRESPPRRPSGPAGRRARPGSTQASCWSLGRGWRCSAWADTFTGWQFLVVGVTGLLIGVALALVTTTLRWPLVAPVLLAIGVLLPARRACCACAPWTRCADPAHLAAAHRPAAVRLEGPAHHAAAGVGHRARCWCCPSRSGCSRAPSGWPWPGGRPRPRWLRAIAPAAGARRLLCLVILLGLARPQSLWVQGVLFAAIALAWLVVRGSGAP